MKHNILPVPSWDKSRGIRGLVYANLRVILAPPIPWVWYFHAHRATSWKATVTLGSHFIFISDENLFSRGSWNRWWGDFLLS